MAGYRSLPLAPASATAMAATVAAQPNVPTMYHHQSMTAMSNNGIIYQSAVHASIHSLNTVQNQRSTTHHILATATATAAAAAAVASAATRPYAAPNSVGGPNHASHLAQHTHHLQQQPPSHPHASTAIIGHNSVHPVVHQPPPPPSQSLMGAPPSHYHHHHHAHHLHHHHQPMALHQNHLFFGGPTLGGHSHSHPHHHRQLFSHLQNAIMPLSVSK